VVKRALLIAVLAAASPAAANAASRIYYASDWSGSMEIYAVDPARRAPPAEITFGLPVACTQLLIPCGFRDPQPSPDGRHLLYRGTDGSLWLARADGQAPRMLQSSGQRADWSRDSRRVAYPAADGVHVVRADGRDDRLMKPGLVGDVVWSPDGKGVVVYTSTGHILPSPDKRWLAVTGVSVGAEVIPIAGRGATVQLGDRVAAAAWAPDSRHLAAITQEGLRVYDIRTRSSRLVTRDTGYRYEREFGLSALGVSWPPHGGSLAYIRGGISPFDGGISSGDLLVTTQAGRLRTVVSTERAFGGRMLSLAWAPAARGLRYRRPPPGPLRRATATSLLAAGPISAVAADGDRVAFIACQGVYTWKPKTGSVTTLEQMGPPSTCADHINYAMYDVAVAGDRVAYADSFGCNVISQRVRLAVLPSAPTTIATGSGNCGAPYHPFVGDLAGGGDLLVFGSWTERANFSVSPTRFDTTQQDVERVEGGGCPCPDIATSPGPLTPADVDGNRVVAFGDRATLLLDRDGRTLLTIPVAPTAAQLSGNDLVVLVPGALRDYDASSGGLLDTWALPDVPNGRVCWLRCLNVQLSLEDASHGLVAYVLDRQVHLLRLADGADKVVARGRAPRLMDAGLVYADGSRLWVVPYAKLPLRAF
jgi:hypothetical protein